MRFLYHTYNYWHSVTLIDDCQQKNIHKKELFFLSYTEYNKIKYQFSEILNTKPDYTIHTNTYIHNYKTTES